MWTSIFEFIIMYGTLKDLEVFKQATEQAMRIFEISK